MSAKLHRHVLDSVKKRKRPAENQQPIAVSEPAAPGIPRREPRPPTVRKGGARLHHYNFAHRALRDAFFHAPSEFAAELLTRRDDLLELIWASVGDWAVE